MQSVHPGHKELVLRLDATVRHEGPLSYEQAGQYLAQVIRMSSTTPYYYTYVDKPGVHTICQTNSPPFNVDVLRYLEPEHVYKVPLGHYELEVAETKYGFIPGSGEQVAQRMRRKMRFSKGGMPAIVLVHYSRGPAGNIPLDIPSPLQNQPVRQYPLVPSNEPGVFVTGERTGQKVFPPGQQPPGQPNGQGFPPHGTPVRGGVNPQVHAQNAAIAAQNAAMNLHRSGGPPAKSMVNFDENDEDESDAVTHRDLSATRFIRNHEFLAELFSPEPLPAPSEVPEEKVEDLEATLAKLTAELEALNQKTTELETTRLTNESAALAL